MQILTSTYLIELRVNFTNNPTKYSINLGHKKEQNDVFTSHIKR